ncbi:MAG TPA: glycosyltransferase N-terminal domain-containing protein [Opitutaceae bacterium]|nr:glycosyltransferase N-terminal domain-containing protein [Opitutaceae bacterium]
MLWLYRLLFLPALLLASPYYLLRMRRRGGYRRHFAQRLGAIQGLGPKPAGMKRIWIQAVSVGEMLAIGPILEAFRTDRFVEIYLTTTTSTGYKVASERYRELTAAIGYFPIDWWPFSANAWYRVDPDLVVLTEGERWPEHVNQAVLRKVPVISINARISDRSFRRLQSFPWVARQLTRGHSRILACSEHDAQRFRQLGFVADSVSVTGNIKLDLSIPELSAQEKTALRHELGLGTELVLLGSSTWEGEETALVETLRACRAAGIACRLLLVPRHAERRSHVEAALRNSGFSYLLRTRGLATEVVDVAVADTTGELRRLTQLADVVFVGKSLPPHDQGQTPVEAASLGRPLLFGPGMTNFRGIAEELVKAGAAVQVADVNALAATAIELLKDPARRTAMATAAKSWHVANQGALERTLTVLRDELDRIEERVRAANLSKVGNFSSRPPFKAKE